MPNRPQPALMPPEVSVASPAEAGEWEAYVESRGDAVGYHSWHWRRVFSNAFGHEPVYLVARHDDAIVGVLPLVQIKSLLFGCTLTSLPFLNYGGVMADTSEVARALMGRAHQEARARKCSHVELRHVGRQFPELPCKQHKVAMRLALAPGMWDRLDRKVRNQIRKAEKSGLVVERGGEALVGDFYAVFARNMRDLGTPVYSRRLFEEVLRAFPDRAQLHVVRLGTEPIAAGLTYRTTAMVQLPWASSIRSFNTMCPNVLLYWDAIQYAQSSGAGAFDMGRSTPNEGTFKFKAQWGTEPVPLHWEYSLTSSGALPNVSPANPKYHLAIALWQQLPLAVTTRVGPMIVRAIP
ncbi:MAG TPA: FemAB family XrtA/PEP-CTERM system-associated protein [Vicinamibacterales bacterium]|nr:FemAB family XrtA/PEP-CTERM system-associated protein [Vicinamibacterales bacterium]